MPPGERSASRFGSWIIDQPYLLLSLTSLFWAANTVLGRYIVGHVPPVTLALGRWAGAFLILLPFAAPYLIRDWPLIRRHFWILLVFAATGVSAYNTLAYWGLAYTSAINGLLLASTGPLFVALWTFALFRERLTARQAGGILMSLVGAVVIITRGSLAVLTHIAFNRGDILILIALAIYGFYAAGLRRRPQLHPMSFLAVSIGLGALLLVPVEIWELGSGKTVVLDAATLWTFVYVAVFPSLLGYLFINRGIELIGANRAAPFLHLSPVFGSVMAVAFLGEHFELYHAIGYALVVVGITVATRK